MIKIITREERLRALGFQKWSDYPETFLRCFHFPCKNITIVKNYKDTGNWATVLCRLFVTGNEIMIEFSEHPIEMAYEKEKGQWIRNEIWDKQNKEWYVLLEAARQELEADVEADRPTLSPSTLGLTYTEENLNKALSLLERLGDIFMHGMEDIVIS